MKLKEEYTNSIVSHKGMRYDMSQLDERQLKKVWETEPELRNLFEEDEEDRFFKNMPPDKTEEEFFEESLAKVGIITSRVAAKRLEEMKKTKKK